MTTPQDYLDDIARFGDFTSVTDVTDKEDCGEFPTVVLEAQKSMPIWGHVWVRVPIKAALLADDFPASTMAEIMLEHMRSHMAEAGLLSESV